MTQYTENELKREARSAAKDYMKAHGYSGAERYLTYTLFLGPLGNASLVVRFQAKSQNNNSVWLPLTTTIAI